MIIMSYHPHIAATNYPSKEISAAIIGYGACSDLESSTIKTNGLPLPLGCGANPL